MALSARELFLIVRAQNQASGVLRRISGDMSALGRKEMLRAKQTSLNVAKARNENDILNKQARIRQLTAQAGLSAEKNRLGQAITAQNVAARETSNVRRQLDNADARNNLEKRYNDTLIKRNQLVDALRDSSRHGPGLDQDAQKAMRTQIRQYDSFLKSYPGKMRSLKGQFHELGLQLGSISGAQQKMGATARSAAQGEQTLQDRIQAERRALGVALQQRAQLAEKQRDLNDTVKAFRTERIGQAMHLLGSMGRQLQLVGFGGAAALGFAANAAANLSTSVTLATTQYKNNVTQIKAASDTNFGFIIKQMREFPSAAEDMSASLYDIFSTLNVNGKQGRDILEQVNKAAVAGSISTQEATSGVLSVLSNFKEIAQTGAGTEKALTRMFAAVRFGRTTMAEFAASLQTTAPAANQTGQTFDNLAGSVAFLSRSLGINKASVGYARLLQQLTSTAMVKGLKEHGISVRNAAGQYKQLDQIVGEITQKFPKLTTGQMSAQNFFKAMSNTTGTIQGARAFTALVRNVDGYNKILNDTINDNNEFDKSFRALNQTAGVQFGRALNVLKSLWLDLGRAAIPTIAKLLSPIGELADKLSQMDQATKDNIGRIAALAVAITGVTGVVLSLVAAFGGAFLILGAISGPLLLGISAGFLAIGAAIYLIITNWDKIAPRLKSALPAIQSAVQAAIGGIQNILEKTAGLIANFVGIVDALIRGDWGDLWNSAGEAVGHFSDLVTIAVRGAGQAFSAFLNMAASGVQGYVAATAIGVVVSTKLASSLIQLSKAYRLVAEGQAIAAVTSGGGIGARIGAGVSDLVTTLRILGMEFSRSRAAGMGFGRSLLSLVPLLAGASGGTLLLVGALAAIGVGLAALIVKYDTTTYKLAPFTAAQQSAMAAAQGLTSNLLSEANAVEGLANAFDTLGGAKLDRAQAALDVKTSKLSLSQARKAAQEDGKITQAEKLNLQGLRLQVARSQRALGAATKQYQTAREGFRDLASKANQQLSGTDFRASQAQIKSLTDQINAAKRALPGLELKARTGQPQDVANWGAAFAHVQQLEGELAKLKAASDATSSSVRKSVSNYIKAALPNITGEQLQVLEQATEKVGHILTPKQMKILLKTEGGKEAVQLLKNLEKGQKDLGRRHTVMHISTKVDTKGGKSAADIARQQFQTHHANFQAGKISADPNPAIQAAKKASAALDKVGNKKVHPQINTQFKPDVGSVASTGASLGAAAKTGVLAGASGLGAQLGAQMSADVVSAINQAKAAAEAKSPSKKTKREIGIPLAQGIIEGFSGEMKKNWNRTAKSVQRLIIKGLDFSGQSKKEIAKTISDAYKQAMDTAVQTLKDKWQEIHDLNQQNFGELFQGEGIATKIEWGQKLNIGDLQKDLNAQLAKFRDFNASLNRLRRRGGPQSLIDQLRQLGPAAQGELDALNGATKAELRKYERTWKASQRAINRATKQQFKQQVKEWKSQGKAIAAGILMGLRGEERGLERYFRHIWQRMIHATRKHNKSHSPSRLYAQEGVNVIEGFRLGMERASRGMAVPSPGVGPAWGRRGAHAGAGGGMVINQTIHAHHSESLDTTLRKANFRLKHRNT